MTLRTVGEEERLLDRRGIRVVVFDHLAIHGAPVSCCCGLKRAGAQLDHLGAARQVEVICLFSLLRTAIIAWRLRSSFIRKVAGR